MSNIFSSFNDWGLLILRVVFAAIFLAHGLPKIKNLKGTGEWFASEGFRPGFFWALVVGLTETLGAIMIALGLWVSFVAPLFIVDMLVATFWKVSKGMGLKDGYELDLILLAVAFFLAANGGGSYILGGSFW